MIFALALLAADAPLADGLPAMAKPQVDAAIAKWGECLKKFSTDAAELTSDPTNIVVDISFYACRSEQDAAEFAWRRMLVTSSTNKPTDEQAEKMARDTFARLAEGKRQSLMVQVSLKRQIQTLDRQKRELRRSLAPPK